MGRLRVSSALLGCLLLAGCRHKVRPVVPVTSTAPIPVEKAPEPKNPPVIAQVPLTPAPLPAVQVPTKKKPRKKRPVAEPAAPPPVQVASVAPPPDPGSVIGSLTVGGDDAPEKRRQASGMLGELDKRLAGLSPSTQEQQKEGLTRVRYFEREARAALESGDLEGAVTLATKAKLLLDDLVK
jgi:hypothetical protein